MNKVYKDITRYKGNEQGIQAVNDLRKTGLLEVRIPRGNKNFIKTCNKYNINQLQIV